MKDKERGEKIIIGTLLVLLIVSIGFNINLYSSRFKTVEEKALVEAQIYDWFANEDDPTELVFDYSIYNYGDIEAKNIEVRCSLYDEDGTRVIASVLDNYGNLASKSYEFGEVVTDDVTNSFDYYSALCYVESCDDCEILYKRIPELIVDYE